MEKTMKVEIWSDIMCPFCYIGKRRFEQALAQLNPGQIQIEWKSFLLDPSMKPVAGKNIHHVLAEKKGWAIEYAEKINQQVAEMGSDVGLAYQFDKVIPANSFDAHRLTHLAATHGLQDAAEEKLFKAYFVEGKDIGAKSTLTTIGEDIGLSKQEVHDMLESDAFDHNVKADMQEAQQLGIRGVPFFVFDRKFAVSGAQPAEVFSKTMHAAWQKHKKENPIEMNSNNSCQLNGNC
jgi:predicted DsbA family dithiol-disulfide isomerase